jgi:hypothetical protein
MEDKLRRISSGSPRCSCREIIGPRAAGCYAQDERSNVRYWIASLRCRGSMLSATSRSAIVRATFRMRSCARAERPSRVMAFSNSFSPSGVIAQYLRIILGSQGRPGVADTRYLRFRHRPDRAAQVLAQRRVLKVVWLTKKRQKVDYAGFPHTRWRNRKSVCRCESERIAKPRNNTEKRSASLPKALGPQSIQGLEAAFLNLFRGSHPL